MYLVESDDSPKKDTVSKYTTGKIFFPSSALKF